MAKDYLVSIEAEEVVEENGELQRLGDVLVVNAANQAEAKKIAPVPAGFKITNVTHTTPDEPDEILPADYEVQR